MRKCSLPINGGAAQSFMKPTVLRTEGTQRDLPNLAWVEQLSDQKHTAAYYSDWAAYR